MKITATRKDEEEEKKKPKRKDGKGKEKGVRKATKPNQLQRIPEIFLGN